MKQITKAVFALALAGGALASTVTGSGKQIEQNREIADFSALSTNGAFELVLTAGSKPSFKITGDDNLVALVETAVSGGELQVRMKKDTNLNVHHSLKIELTVPRLVRYTAEGAGTTNLRNLSGDRLDVSFQGAGVLKASGTIQKLNLDAQGAGVVDMKELKATDAKVAIQGVGSVNVYASNMLDASVEGVGSLTYYGHPKTLRKSANGLGSVSAGN